VLLRSAYGLDSPLLVDLGSTLGSVLGGDSRLRSLNIGRVSRIVFSRRIVSGLFEPDEIGAYLCSGKWDGRGLRKSQ
jgi:hypothetical protein